MPVRGDVRREVKGTRTKELNVCLDVRREVSTLCVTCSMYSDSVGLHVSCGQISNI